MKLDATLLALLGLAASASHASPITWTGTVNSNWDTSTLNWSPGGTAFGDGRDVVFDDIGNATVTLAASVAPNDVTITNATKAYTLTTGANTLTAETISKSDAAPSPSSTTPREAR